MGMKYSEWGDLAGDEAAEISMNLNIQGCARVLLMPCREGNEGLRKALKEGILFCKKRYLWHKHDKAGNESISQWPVVEIKVSGQFGRAPSPGSVVKSFQPSYAMLLSFTLCFHFYCAWEKLLLSSPGLSNLQSICKPWTFNFPPLLFFI